MVATFVERPPLEFTDTLVSRLYGRVTVQLDTGCWLWMGCVTRSTGYGKIKVGDEAVDTHVLSWRIANGGKPVPVGSLVMHSCDSRRCINPVHLSLGVPVENGFAASVRGRLGLSSGESRPNSVLTEQDVLRIRSLRVRRRFSSRRIASQLGLSVPAVEDVIKGRTWQGVR